MYFAASNSSLFVLERLGAVGKQGSVVVVSAPSLEHLGPGDGRSVRSQVMAAVGAVGGNGARGGPFYVAVDGEAVPERGKGEDDVRDASK